MVSCFGLYTPLCDFYRRRHLLDTDVMVYKKFDEFLDKSFFTSIELHPKSFADKGVAQIDSNEGSI